MHIWVNLNKTNNCFVICDFTHYIRLLSVNILFYFSAELKNNTTFTSYDFLGQPSNIGTTSISIVIYAGLKFSYLLTSNCIVY